MILIRSLDQLIHKNLKMLRLFAHKGHGQIWTYIGHACIPEIWPFLVRHLLQWIFVSYIESKLCYVEILKKMHSCKKWFKLVKINFQFCAKIWYPQKLSKHGFLWFHHSW